MRMRYFIGFWLLLFAPVEILAQEVWPDIFPPKPQVRLIAAQTAVGQGRIEIGVHISLGRDWKTYAQNPGQTGIPPKFNWTGSQNLKSAWVRFPQPMRIKVFDSEIIGYQNEVVFPVVVDVEDRGRPLHLRLDLSYAICADLCIPLQERFSLTLLAGASRSSAHRALIRRFIDKVPQSYDKQKQTQQRRGS